MNYYILLVTRFLSRILFVFPIKRNRILFYSFSGKQFSCSPKYISEYLKANSKEPLEIIWAFNHPEEFEYIKKYGYKVIKYKSFIHAYYTVTSRVIVTNTGPFKAIANRDGQEIINTWHGGGAYKKTGMDNPYKNKLQYFYNKNLGQAGVTLFVSSSKLFTKYAIRGAFGYKGRVMECGLPRNDILLDKEKMNQIREDVRKTLRISQSEMLILYAPTWRNYSIDSFEKIDIEGLCNCVSEVYGKKSIFAFRGHSLSKNDMSSANIDILNLTDYPDMQELLIAADILISDYSSCIWDYSLLRKPGYLYAPDLKEYNVQFSFYTEIEKWGFPVAINNSELFSCIYQSVDNYKERIKINHNYFQNTESGSATRQLSEYIWNCIKKEDE